ncbi:succinylglutamate desuccinylase/aspartoacylase domain-containing protein [Spartinivicinus marinus]|nr:succinylglutamate desuccinylase/aspartoacylase family protein [Spartinivicinus marinus]MCX4025394.1 succinylglutamate desuccinylase/aspartoacylase family protein [Spartinivicinus marinus]
MNKSTSSLINVWTQPDPEEIGHSIDEFLSRLKQPTIIQLSGLDDSRTRVISTLLHGNEPSGLYAVFNWLKSGKQPAVNTVFFVGAVTAALEHPRFFYRHLPDERDLNRCFKEPFDDYPGHVAKSFLDFLKEEQPECLIDIHNTSGSGPAFAVSICNDLAHQTLVSHFVDRLIVTNLRLGSLMELSEQDVPTITVECGGTQDEQAHLLAIESVDRFLSLDDVFQYSATDRELEILYNPVRIELKPDATIAYNMAPVDGVDITLPLNIEHLNFGVVDTDIQLGWLGERGIDCFQVVSHEGKDISQELLRVEGNQLFPKQPVKAFMITTNPIIAKSDCLFYAVTCQG